jgi:hypothetical protein
MEEKAGTRWTPSDDMQLRDIAARGESVERAAVLLQRTPGAVQAHARLLCLAPLGREARQ